MLFGFFSAHDYNIQNTFNYQSLLDPEVYEVSSAYFVPVVGFLQGDSSMFTVTYLQKGPGPAAENIASVDLFSVSAI